MHRSLESLPHELDRERLTCRAIVETPHGSRAKFSYDADSGLFELNKLLPAGLAFPLDFGFVPSTLGGDGDPIDLLILADVELPVGCLVTVRLIGAIEVEQTHLAKGRTERNDRLIGRLAESHAWAHIDRLDQLGQDFVDELNSFFATYKMARGQHLDVLAVSGPERALELIEQAANNP